MITISVRFSLQPREADWYALVLSRLFLWDLLHNANMKNNCPNREGLWKVSGTRLFYDIQGSLAWRSLFRPLDPDTTLLFWNHPNSRSPSSSPKRRGDVQLVGLSLHYRQVALDHTISRWELFIRSTDFHILKTITFNIFTSCILFFFIFTAVLFDFRL